MSSDIDDNVRRLLTWIAERESIRKRRAAGEPPPWSTDPIFVWSFCNVRREDDRVTRWITEHWRTPHADDPDLWFVMAVARVVNWDETLAELGYPIPWNREHFVAVLHARGERDEKVWGDAYTGIVGDKGIPRPVCAADVLDRLWTARDTLRPREGESCADLHGRLIKCDKLGEFRSAQIVADVKYVPPLKHASDWSTFAAPGPGSERGLNRLLGRPKNNKWREVEWRAELRKLHDAIKPELAHIDLGDLHAQDLQNCLCEFDKYERVRLGEGTPRRRFTPRGAQPAPRPRPSPTRSAPTPTPPPVSMSLDEEPMSSDTHGPDSSVNGSGAPPSGDEADIFSNLSAIRLTPEEAGTIGTEEVLVQVSVRKPNVSEFVRVHPSPSMALATTVYVDHEREAYFVAPALRNVMVAGGLKAMLLVAAVNQRGLLFLWPIALGDATGRRNAWHDSARQAMELAKTQWVKMISDMPAGQYRIYRAKGKLPEPVFPADKTMQELLRLAFRGHVIDSEDHPAVKQAIGLIP